MAHTIKLGNFKKHEESTARPNTTGWAEYSVVFKEGADVVDPQLTISVASSTVTGYNYGVMDGRYYWIRGINLLRNGLAVLDLETDVLATYKTEIGNENLYILRSSAQFNGRIVDNYYPPTADPTIYSDIQDPDTIPYVDFNQGYYLLTAMGLGNSAGGAEFIYQLTPAKFKQVINKVYTRINGYTAGDIIESIVQDFGGNPQELISGAVWVPWDFPAVSNVSVILGGYDTGITADLVTKATVDLAAFSYTIRKHPKAATRGAYLNSAPYSYYTLLLNCGGAIELDSSKLVDATSITVSRTLDTKGTVLNTITGSDGYVFGKIFGQMGVPISLNGNNTGGAALTGIVSTIAGTAAAIATGGGSAIVGAATGGIGSLVHAMSGAYSNSSSGGVAGIGEAGKLISTFFDIPDEQNAKLGRPLCQVKTPSTLTGYMMAAKGDVEIPGTITEQRKIKQYLETGFYYE